MISEWVVLQADDQFSDYAPKVAFLFPGQGAQTVGMAKVRLTSLCYNPSHDGLTPWQQLAA